MFGLIIFRSIFTDSVEGVQIRTVLKMLTNDWVVQYWIENNSSVATVFVVPFFCISRKWQTLNLMTDSDSSTDTKNHICGFEADLVKIRRKLFPMHAIVLARF